MSTIEVDNPLELFQRQLKFHQRFFQIFILYKDRKSVVFESIQLYRKLGFAFMLVLL